MKRAIGVVLTLTVLLAELAACGSQNAERSRLSGWWVRPEGYESEGISLIDRFEVDEEGDQLTSFNEYGEEAATLDCGEEGGEFVIHMPYHDVYFTVEGDQLLSSESGAVEFIKVEDPGFAGQDMNFDGRWYLEGDREREYYEISGKSFKHAVPQDKGVKTDKEGTLSFHNVQKAIGNKRFPNVFEMETGEYSPSLMPNEDHTILFESDGLDNAIYVRESALEEDMVPAYRMMNDLMEMDLSAYSRSDKMVTIAFDPLCFYVIVYKTVGQVDLEPVGEPFYGQWELTDGETLRLTFENGTVEDVTLPEPEGVLHVKTLNCDFQLQPVI